jgi:hypothetical protein
MNNIEKYYTNVVNSDKTKTGIGLTEHAGEYFGVIYEYGEVSFAKEENQDGTLNVSFDWKLIDSNGLSTESFNKEEFKNMLGDILVDIIDKHIEQGTLGYEDRDNNIITTNS